MSSKSAFGAVKGVCKVLGIFVYKKSFLNRLENSVNIILIIFQLTLILPSLAYLIRYLSNVNDAAEVLSILFPSILHLGQYSILVLTKPHLLLLFQNFEELLDKSAYDINSKLFSLQLIYRFRNATRNDGISRIYKICE